MMILQILQIEYMKGALKMARLLGADWSGYMPSYHSLGFCFFKNQTIFLALILPYIVLSTPKLYAVPFVVALLCLLYVLSGECFHWGTSYKSFKPIIAYNKEIVKGWDWEQRKGNYRKYLLANRRRAKRLNLLNAFFVIPHFVSFLLSATYIVFGSLEPIHQVLGF